MSTSKNNNAPHSVIWTDAMVTSFWNNLSKTPLRDISFSRLASKHLVDFISSVVPVGGRILDYGAGDGDLACALIEAGFNVAVYEPSQARVDFLLQQPVARKHGFLGVISKVSNDKFDAVCAFEVLEHILEDRFLHDLAEMQSFLKPDGLFIGSVPAEESLELASCLCPACNSFFHRFQHVRNFTHETLRELLDNIGYSNICISVADFTNSFLFIASKTTFTTPVNFRDASLCMHDELNKLRNVIQNQKSVILIYKRIEENIRKRRFLYVIYKIILHLSQK